MNTAGFQIDEFFELAEQIERKGAKFYRQAAASMKVPASRDFLHALAEMEVEHERVFSVMRPKAGTNSYINPEGETAAYLQALANAKVFNIKNDPCEKLTGMDTFADILVVAIAFEKDSILFFLGLAEAMSDPAGKKHIEAIITEERKHIASLTRMLTAAL